MGEKKKRERNALRVSPSCFVALLSLSFFISFAPSSSSCSQSVPVPVEEVEEEVARFGPCRRRPLPPPREHNSVVARKIVVGNCRWRA